jgi:hypothetical protein
MLIQIISPPVVGGYTIYERMYLKLLEGVGKESVETDSSTVP